MAKFIITIVAFKDDDTNSVAYKKFESVEKAVEFYLRQLLDDDVRVISTRKVYFKGSPIKTLDQTVDKDIPSVVM